MPDFFAEMRTNDSFDPTVIEDIGEVSVDNHTYLQEAIAYKPEYASFFLNGGVDINHQDDKGQTALQYAISRQMYDLAFDIVRNGADVGLLDQYGNDALWTAVLSPRPNIELIRLLTSKGADPHRKNAAKRSSADMAITKKNESMMEIFGSK